MLDSKKTAKKIEDFFSTYRLRKYKKGQIIILNDEQPQYIFFLASGRVKQYDVTYRGDEVILNIFKEKSFFPMSIAINHTPNPYIFEAATDIEIYQAPIVEAEKFVLQNQDVMLDLLKRVYVGTDGLIGRIVHLMSSSAKGRLMYEILVSAQREGKRKADGSIIIELNEKDLGARSGLSRETVSREITKLTRDNLLAYKGGKITIQNFDKFQSKLRSLS